ncbi:MAG: hypothetical protein ACTSYN_01700 [Candidatus Heimdallarchaeaceae archaeon]
MDKNNILEILDNHLLGATYLNEEQLAERLGINSQKLRSFFLECSETAGFIKDGKKIFLAQELIRANLDSIHTKFWKWYISQVPSSSQLAWEEGASIQDFTAIKVIEQQISKKGIIKSFMGRIILLGEENTGKQSFIYALTGQSPNQPAPGVIFSKITRQVDNFIAEFETIILQIPPGSSLWLYAKTTFGIILFYDLTRIEETFPKMQTWLQTFLDTYTYPFCPPILILGTKLDRLPEVKLREHSKRVFEYKDFLEKEYGTIVLTNTISLIKGIRVAESFDSLARTIREWYIIIKEEYEGQPIVE